MPPDSNKVFVRDRVRNSAKAPGKRHLRMVTDEQGKAYTVAKQGSTP
jgi:hypothetical protein